MKKAIRLVMAFFIFGTAMLRFVITTLFLFPVCIAVAQTDTTQIDIVDVFLKRKDKETVHQKRSAKKVHFSLLPAAVNVPGGGKAVLTAANAAFYMGDPEVTNLSNVYLIPYTNLSNRYGLFLRPNLWLAKNSFNIVGDYRIAHFPQYSWGLGGDSPQWDQSLIDANFFRFYQSAFRKIVKAWYAGPGYALDHYYQIKESDYEGKGHLERYDSTANASSTSSGITFNLVYDARVNAINPPRGAYLLVAWRWNSKSLGSTFNSNTLFVDLRKYFKLHPVRYNVLALRSFYWTVVNGKVPYLDLPSSNWAPSGGISNRGFQSGRYRSNALLYAETEQRFQLTENGLLGVVAFLNISSASEFDTQQFKHWHAGAGFGMRLKMNKYSNSNIAIDLGFSQNYWGVWLNIGEMF